MLTIITSIISVCIHLMKSLKCSLDVLYHPIVEYSNVALDDEKWLFI